MNRQSNAIRQEVYDASDIQQILSIGRSQAYILMNEAYQNKAPFRVIRIGKLLRATKKSFDAWLAGNEN